MATWISYKANKTQQYLISILLIAVVAAICFSLSQYIGYHVVALLLLVTVSFIAMFFDILPVLLAAFLSALIWNVFFIPPRFSLSVGTTEDALFLAMYFVIASVNAALTFKIRQIEKKEVKKEQKENTLKLYNTLLNSLSHELRTPISTIIGATDNLIADATKLSDENKEELLTEISKASFRLNRQVENLLNMSRIESGFLQLKKDWVDVNELLYDVVKRLKEQTQHHPVSILVKENLPLFKLDFGLMEHVLYNLIYNATIYIPKYSVITVKASCINEKLVINVEDTGNGFPEDETEKVFDKFYRLKNSKTGGTGLGLSIVKGFVEAHDGTVRLENIPEGGAKFTIEIPAEISCLSSLKNE
ncbi:MAG TPA: ATP-binding protein [Bacteroidia bacterium]|nr:ATP-binding protein [Bacteroidia bacterium]